jgi:hypothetical protein
LQGVSCFPSGWCDLSTEHAEVRKRAEEILQHATAGQGYQLTIIVAPYGSGKTTLLKHLEWYAREKLAVPAARVELKDIVNYIIERFGMVHESDLPKLIESYAYEKLGTPNAVLLVDEVEESYDTLAAVVEHETSPLRGLADAAREGRLRTVVLLAFGPSSALKEALFGPVAWRARIIGLPLIGKGYVTELLRGLVDEEVLEAIANTVWWMARGRTAWALFAVENVVPRLVKALERGPTSVSDLLHMDNVFESEIVDGVPLLDRTALTRLADIMGAEAAALLAVFVGPLPYSKLSKILGTSIPTVSVVYARSGIRLEDVLAQARKVMSRVARSIGATSDAVDRAYSLLRSVLGAWSFQGVVPHDVSALKELFSIASDLAREVYVDEPSVHKLLESIDVVAVAPQTIELEEPLIALRPEIIVQLYPLATSSPLIGCARHVSGDKLLDVVAGLSFEELVSYSEKIGSAMSIDQLLSKLGLKRLVLLPSHIASKHAAAVVCRSLEEPLAVVVGGRAPKVLEVAEQLGRLVVVEATEKMDRFMLAVLYNEAVGLESCSIDSLGDRDRRSLQQFTELTKSMIIEKASSRRRGELAIVMEKLRTLVKGLGPLGDTVISAVSSSSAPELLTATLKQIEDIVSELEAKLKQLLGIHVPPRIPISEALSEAAKLYLRAKELGLELLEEALRACGARILPSGGEEQPSTILDDLAQSLEEASRLKLNWLPLRLKRGVEETLKTAREMVKLISSLQDRRERSVALVAISPIISTLRSLLKVLVRGEDLYVKLSSRLSMLPEELRSKIFEHFTSTVKEVSSVVELEATISRLEGEAEELSALAEELASLQRIRDRKLSEVRSLIHEIDRIIHEGEVVEQV